MLNKEEKEKLRKAFKEPYPRNLILTLAENRLFDIEIDINNITEDMIEGLEYAISTLPPRDQEVIRMRYAEKMTFVAIGQRFDVTGERIRTVEHRAIIRLLRPPLLGYIKYGKQGFVDHCAKIKEQKAQAYKEDKYQLTIQQLDLSVRAHNRLIAAGYDTVKDFFDLSEDEIIKIKCFGKKSIIEVALKLESLGISGTNWSRFIPKNKGE